VALGRINHRDRKAGLFSIAIDRMCYTGYIFGLKKHVSGAEQADGNDTYDAL